MPLPDIAATVRAFSRARVSATSPGPPVTTLLDRALVEMRRPRLDRNAGRFEQRAAHLALRRKHQRLSGSQRRHQRMNPKNGKRFSKKIMRKARIHDACCRRRSASSASTAAAVSSIERRVTSMIGQLCRAQSLRENAISSATAWRST